MVYLKKMNDYGKSKITNEYFYKNKKEAKNNYIILARDFYLYPNIISKNVKFIKTPEKRLRKKQAYNNLNLSKEINLENKFNEINESFHDEKKDRESLILQISETKKLNESKFPQAKTPDKTMKYFKKSIINKKLNNANRTKKINKDINCYNNNNITTAKFNDIGDKNKKYNESSFYDNDKNRKDKNNRYKNIHENKNVLFGQDEKSLKIINDNIIKGKYKFLLKLQNDKNKLNANKSFDDIKYKIIKSNIKPNSKYLNYKKNFINKKEKYEYDIDDLHKINKSFDFAIKYKKKIINKKNNKFKRNKTKDIFFKKDNIFNDMNKNHSKLQESNIIYSSLFNLSLNISENNREHISQNKTLDISNAEDDNSIIMNSQNILNITSITINFEELMILGERLYEIYRALIINKKIENQCFEYLNYFFYSSFKNDIENIILNSDLKESIYCLNYILFFILIIYDYSSDKNITEKNFSLISKTLLMILNIYIILYEFIIKKVNDNFKSNIWISKLKNLISMGIKNVNANSKINFDTKSDVNNIINLSNDIIKNINILLNKFKSNNNHCLNNFFQEISQKNNEEIKTFFDKYIIRKQHMTNFIDIKNNFIPAPEPYITKNDKINFNPEKYSLVLGLEETLLNFKINLNTNKGIVRLRPYLFPFLDSVQNYFNLILFTFSESNFANKLIEVIESDKKYFSHKFFLEHNIIMNDFLVKDISRIGIDLDKIIIIDNMPNNYSLQEKNGILIKSFWGEDNENNDKKLFYLKDILIKISNDGGDVRKSIEKYKEDIMEKISSNIYGYFNSKNVEIRV